MGERVTWRDPHDAGVSSGPDGTSGPLAVVSGIETVENVLLLPGWLQRGSTLDSLGDALEAAGFTVFALTNADRVSITPQQEAVRAEERLEDIKEATGKRSAVVGHSQGAIAGVTVHARREDLVMRSVAISGIVLDIAFDHPEIRRGITIHDGMEPLALMGVTRNPSLEHRTVNTMNPLFPFLYDPDRAHRRIVDRPEVHRITVNELRQPQPVHPVLMRAGQAVRLAG